MVWQKVIAALVLIGSVGLAGRAIQQPFIRTDSSTQLIVEADPKAIQQASALVPALLDDNAEIREQAFKELQALDINASIPALVQALKDKDWKLQVIAAYTLGRLGAKAKPAISELNSKIKDENADIRFAVAQSLGNIGSEDVVPALMVALRDQDENVRCVASEALVKLGADAKAAIPVLMKTLRDGNWFVRSRAANAFVHLAPQSSSLTPALIEAALNNRLEESPWGGGSEYVEYHLQRQQKIPAVVAFDALAEIGSEAAPPLIEALKSDDTQARRPNPTLALVEMGSKADSDQVVALLIRALHHADWTVRNNATLALGGIGSKTAIPALINIPPGEWEAPRYALGQIGFRVILGQKRVDEPNKTFLPTLTAALRSEDWQIRSIAAAALGMYSDSDAAVSALRIALQDEDWQVRSNAVNALGSVSSEAVNALLTTALQDQDWRVRSSAIDSVSVSEFTTPILATFLQDENENVRLRAALKLNNSEAAIPILASALQHQDSGVRFEAIRALDFSNLEAAIPAFISALQDENEAIRGEAVSALDSEDDLPVVAIPALINTLQDKSAKVRASAASALDQAGELAVPALVRASQDDNEDVRRLAIESLGRIGSETGVSALNVALQDESESVRDSAARALSNIQEATKKLQHDDWQVRRSAAEEIGVIGIDLTDPSNPTVQALIQALQDQNPNVRTSAAAALVKLDSPQGRDLTPATANAIQDVVPDLIDSLKNGDSLARLDTIFVLGAIGSDAQAAIPHIQDKLKDENWLVRYGAAVTLLKINPKDESAVPVLAEIFSDTNYAQMIEIDSCCTEHNELDALAEIGSDQAIAALINSLQISDEKLRYTYYLEDGGDRPLAASNLIKIGSKAIPALIAALENENVRFMAADTLGQIGAKSIPPLLEVLKRKPNVEPALGEILKDKDVDVRRSAVYALGQIGKVDLASKATVIEILTTVMNDEGEHLDVRWMAAASLEKLGKTVEQFFIEYNMPKPAKDICIESRFIDRFLSSDFDLYAARCLFSAGGRGAGLSQIYQQIRILLSRSSSSDSTTPKPTTSPNETPSNGSTTPKPSSSPAN